MTVPNYWQYTYFTAGNWTIPNTYFCQGNFLELECGESKLMHITKAEWGRKVGFIFEGWLEGGWLQFIAYILLFLQATEPGILASPIYRFLKKIYIVATHPRLVLRIIISIE